MIMLSLLLVNVLICILFVVISLMALIVPSIILMICRNRKSRKCLTHKSSADPKTESVVHNVMIELLRAFNCGLLMGCLFLQLMPRSRHTFEVFLANQLSAGAAAVQTLMLTQHSHYWGIPFVELMLCLSFFTIHFTEELLQTCLKYRKYYWFSCNANIIYTNQVTDEIQSLSYRLNKTRHYLIACSRKTSQVNSFANTSSTNATAKQRIQSPVDLQLKDSLDTSSVPYESLQTSTLSSRTSQSSQLPSYWKANEHTAHSGLKVFLPQLTAANSTPLLTILEGLVISSQDSFPTLVITFGVIIFNKIVTAFQISQEIYDRTQSNRMPVAAIIAFCTLPALGFLIVLTIQYIICVDPIERRISSMVLSVMSSAAVLHIIFTTIRNNYMQFVLPQRNAIVHHFITYSAFLLVLGVTAYVNQYVK